MADLSDGTGIGQDDIGESGNFEVTIQTAPGIETVIDPLVGTYTQSTSPWSKQPAEVFEVDVKVQVGVTSRVRHDNMQWRKTDTYTSTFYLDTTTFQYSADMPAFTADVWDFVQEEISNGAQVSLHGSVWLDNPTHPPVAAGVIRLPKGHRDVAYTQQEFIAADWLEARLNNICADLKNTARY